MSVSIRNRLRKARPLRRAFLIEPAKPPILWPHDSHKIVVDTRGPDNLIGISDVNVMQDIASGAITSDKLSSASIGPQHMQYGTVQAHRLSQDLKEYLGIPQSLG